MEKIAILEFLASRAEHFAALTNMGDPDLDILNRVEADHYKALLGLAETVFAFNPDEIVNLRGDVENLTKAVAELTERVATLENRETPPDLTETVSRLGTDFSNSSQTAANLAETVNAVDERVTALETAKPSAAKTTAK